MVSLLDSNLILAKLFYKRNPIFHRPCTRCCHMMSVLDNSLILVELLYTRNPKRPDTLSTLYTSLRSDVSCTSHNSSRHTCECVMSHVWMSHVTHTTESCHPWMSHVTHGWVRSHMDESCHTWICRGMSQVTSHISSCHVCEWVMSHMWTRHVAHVNESCHTCKWVMWMSRATHMWISRVADVKESCHTRECVKATHVSDWSYHDISTIHERWGGWGRDPFSRNLMSPTPRRKWYLTTGHRFN